MNPGITPQQAKAFYDRFGARQDSHSWIEDSAVERMIEVAHLESATAVLEIGFGTGRLAERLFRDHLSSECCYTGVEVSTTMMRLAEGRLEQFRNRVTLHLRSTTPNSPPPTLPHTVDRYIACYVLDLMTEEDIHRTIAEAWSILSVGGLFCAVSLTHGSRGLSSVVSKLWERIQAFAPQRVGGCRPVSPRILLETSVHPWQVDHSFTVSRFGVSAEVMIARKAIR